MRYSNLRKHPRVAQKQIEHESETTLTLSAACAAGILGFTFLNGMALGYLMRKRMK